MAIEPEGHAKHPLSAVPFQQVPMSVGENVLQYGAKGDGATDDTAAIQSCLNNFAGTAIIFVPDTGQPYMVGPLTVPAGADLLIYGTLMAKPNSGTILSVVNANNVTVRGHGTLDGNGVTLASAPTITTPPINAANDAAALAAGVPIGGEYRNGSVKMIRVA